MSKKNPKNWFQKSIERGITGLFFIVLSLFLVFALISHNPADWNGSSRTFYEPSKNLIGKSGAFVSHHIFEAVGYTSYAVVLFLITTGIVILLHRKLSILLGPAFFLCVTGLFVPLLIALTVDIGADNTRVEPAFRYGGILGGLLAHYMVTYLGMVGTYLISLVAILISLVLTTNMKPSTAVEFLLAAFRPFVKIMAETPEKFKESKQLVKTKTPQESHKDSKKAEPKVHRPFLTPLELEEISKALEKEDEIQEDPLRPIVEQKNYYKTFTDSQQAESAKDSEELGDK